MAKKEITKQFKLQAPGGTATPAPPIGPALGQHGVNPGQFIQKFNAMSAHLKGKVIGCIVTVYKDRTFDIELKASPASVLLKEAVKAEKGSGEPNKTKIGKISMSQCRKIAEEKMTDLNAVDIDKAVEAVKAFPPTKFDQSVELIFSLGIDAKQADQMIRGSLSLPHGIGKAKRVIAFCPDHLVTAALNAGAIKAGSQSLVEE